MQRNKASFLQPRRGRRDCVSLVSRTFEILPKLISGGAIQEFGASVIQRDALNRTRASCQTSERSSGSTTNQPWDRYWLSVPKSLVVRRCVVATPQSGWLQGVDSHSTPSEFLRYMCCNSALVPRAPRLFCYSPSAELDMWGGWADCNPVTRRITKWCCCLGLVKRGLIVMETAPWNKERDQK